MKIVQINTACGVGSTGKVCVDISKMLTEHEIENYILYSSRTNGYKLGIGCSSDRYIKLQAFKSRLFGNYGFNSKKATRRMISELDRISPDIVHLHNIHGHDCNLEMLFGHFKEKETKLIWTFHDCWAFTAYCPHFTMAKCDRWKQRCENCPQFKNYSWIFDKSIQLFEKKKELFSGLDLTVVTPSAWLAGLVKQSIFGKYPIKVINNGIDLDTFKPTGSDFRNRYGIPKEKKILLGVAFDWGVKKGLDVFVELARILDTATYQIVLIGTDDDTDSMLPENIISIHRTQDQRELAEIYAAADLFVNPSREENYPTVNMESVACGTPVLTFDVGGSAEMLDEYCGLTVECGNVAAMAKAINRIFNTSCFERHKCVTKAKVFDKTNKYIEYVTLYEKTNKIYN